MKKTSAASAVRFALFAAAGAAACAWAPQAAADDAVPTTDLGTQADVGGGQQWTVSGLQPSGDPIGAAPAGALWEATATATPVDGGIPMIPGFAARTPAGDSYPVLWTVPTPLGINPSPLPAGESATGKLYFDVTGGAPDAVTYTRDGQDAAVWVQPPPAASAPAPATYGGGTYAYVLPVQPAPAPMAVPRVQAPAAPAAPAPAATGSSGTPAPAAAGATPAPASAGSAGTPQPATGSMGTPATPGAAAAAPAPASTTPAPAAAAPAAPAQANTAPAAGNTPAAGAPAPAAAPAPTPTAPLPSNGSSGTPFIVPTTTPVPVPAG